ncbi:enediyne antibiotic chromoprotein [Longimycelium tulufanense]|nr:enediyne antibiotic chromoprotein [Longimycelium tulufanense]
MRLAAKFRPGKRLAAVAAFGAGLALVAASPAFAAPQSISVDPTTNLRDGQTVTVSGQGFPAGQTAYAAQCGRVGEKFGCHLDGFGSTRVGADGKISISVKVRKSFTAVHPLTGEVGGTVDCTKEPKCVVGAATRASGISNLVPIDFK